MKLKNIAILAFITLFIVIFVNQVKTINVKDFPLKIQYDGKLGSKGKSAVDDGTYTMVFTIYDANHELGGTVLWTETHTDVQVTGGIFSVLLGEITPIELPFDKQYWLGLKVNSDPEMKPRQPLSSVGYSFKSNSANYAIEAGNADTVDNFHASLTPTANTLLPLNSDGKFPASVIDTTLVTKIIAGTNVTISPVTGVGEVTINATGGGSGTVTQVDTGDGLTGGPITTSGTISIKIGGITSSLIADGTITDTDIDITKIQKRVTGSCAGQVITAINADGTVTCEAAGSTGNFVNLQTTTPGTQQTGNLNISGTAIAGSFSGSGLSLTNLNASNISSGTVPFANLPTGTTSDTVAIGNHTHNYDAVYVNEGQADSITTGMIKDGEIVDADVSATANISQSKLALSITNAEVNTGAAIATSKLNGPVTAITGNGLGSLATLNAVGSTEITNGSIKFEDIENNSCGVGQIIQYDGTAWQCATVGGSGTVTSITADGGLTASLTNPITTSGTISIQDGGVTTTKIADGTITDADVSNTAAIAYSKLNLTGLITNTDISATAAIAKSKLAALNIVDADVSATANISDTKLATISTAGKVADSALSNNVTKLGQTIESSEITDDTITTADILPNIVSSVDGVSNDGGDIDLIAGSNITITPNDTNNTITIAASAGTGFVNLAPAVVQTDTTTNSSIFIDKTGASGNLLQLQKSGTDKLVVDNTGAITTGTIPYSSVTSKAVVDADVSAGANISDTKLATISTAGKVADSALSNNVTKLGQTIESAEITDGTITDTDVDTTKVQKRVTGSCAGQVIAGVNADGTVNCEADDIGGSGTVTSITAGTGLTASPTNPITTSGTISIPVGGVTTTEIADSTITNADVSNTAAIAYSKLNLTGLITNTDVSATAAIAKSKLAALNIVDADVSNTAAIATSKISGAVTSITGHGLGSLATLNSVGSAEITDGTITDTDTDTTKVQKRVSGSCVGQVIVGVNADGTVNCETDEGANAVILAPAAVQTDTTTNSSIFINKTGASGSLLQLQKSGTDKLVVDNTGAITTGTIPYSSVTSKAVVDADVSAGAAIVYSKLNLTGLITNTDVSATAAIAKSKLAALNIVDADVSATAAIAPSKILGTAWTGTNDGIGSGLDADLLDGIDSTGFSLSTHNHDAIYVNEGQANSITSSMITNAEIVDADISNSAAIAKSKLAALNIVDADVSNTAAIAASKLSGVVVLTPSSAQTIMPSADVTPLIIKDDAVGITTNLFDVQNNAGTSLVKVNPSGNLLVGNPATTTAKVSAYETGTTNNAGYFEINNASSTKSAIYAIANNTDGGIAIQGDSPDNDTTGGLYPLLLELTNTGGTQFRVGNNGDTWIDGVLTVTENNLTDNAGNFVIGNTASTKSAIYAEINNNTGGGVVIQGNSVVSGPMLLKLTSANIEEFTVANDGKVLIGNPTITTGKLSVQETGTTDSAAKFFITDGGNNKVIIYGNTQGTGNLITLEQGGVTKFSVSNAGNMTAAGTKSAVVETKSYGKVKLYATEATENYFEDYGEGQLQNGEAIIFLDGVYKETIDETSGIKVFVALNDDCNGVFVKTSGIDSFTVQELQGGKSNAKFSYRIVGKRKGYVNVRLEKVLDEVTSAK